MKKSIFFGILIVFCLSLGASIISWNMGYRKGERKTKAEKDFWVTIATNGTEIHNINGTVYDPNELLETTTPPEVAPPKGHPPLKIVIGGDEWTVHYTNKKALDDRGVYGFSNKQNREIWLERDAQTPVQHRETVLHEVLHASLYEGAGFHPGTWQDENEFVEPMSPVLLGVLRDNPEFERWLIQ